MTKKVKGSRAWNVKIRKDGPEQLHADRETRNPIDIEAPRNRRERRATEAFLKKNPELRPGREAGIQEIVDKAPPLTEEQLTTMARIFRPKS